MKHLDAIMIGTGQAGRPWRFAGATTTVAIIERHKFGGMCVNTDGVLHIRSIVLPLFIRIFL